AFESFDFSAFDLVISVSSAEAKGVITSPHTLHICYLLTPSRYLWSHTHHYQTGWLRWLKAWQFSNVRTWDYIAAQRADYFIPISAQVAARCRKYYRRKTEPVIYPSTYQQIATKPHKKQKIIKKAGFLMMVSRLVDYKNVDLAIRACAAIRQEL